jgi:hypothetical protein
MHRWIRVAGLIGAAVMLASCVYTNPAQLAKKNGDPVPWWCHSTEEIPVTQGPVVGSVDYYAGTHKSALSYDDCIAMSKDFDVANAYASNWPTAGAAEADGWRMATPYVEGMGTHHIRGGMTPAILNAKSFNRFDPILDKAGLDDVFNPMMPEVLQYDGNSAAAKLVGFDYYVRTATGQPPQGFAGNNDWWHIHPWICFRTTDATMIAFKVSDSTCTAMNGINVNMSNYYMLHVWVVSDETFQPDVFAGMMPCISGGTAVHDPNSACHTSR